MENVTITLKIRDLKYNFSQSLLVIDAALNHSPLDIEVLLSVLHKVICLFSIYK